MDGSAPPSPPKITAVCAKCRTRYTLPPDSLGKRYRCRECSMYFSVGDPKDPSQARDLTVRRDSPILPEEVKSFAGPASDLPAKFALESEIGRGAFGSVFKAFQSDLGRNVAIKLLHTEEGDAAERFTREARIAAGLSHPNIVPIFEVGMAGDKPYLAMEFVDGKPLHKMQIDVKRSVEIMRDVCSAVGYAHERGVVHRDIKPQNIMVTDDRGRVYVMDFGLARSAKETSATTAAGMVLGTPSFMSPEQAEGLPGVDARSDVYSLGSTLYFLLSGRQPFEAASALALLKKVTEGKYTPIREVKPEVPEQVARIAAKAMALKADHRYPNATAMASDLEAALHTWDRPPAPPPKPGLSKAGVFAIVALLLVAGGSTWWFKIRRSPDSTPPLPPPLNEFDEFVAKARKAISLGRIDEALEASAEAIRLRPDHEEARTLRVRCLVASMRRSADGGKWEEVEERLKEAQALAPDDDDVKLLARRLEESRAVKPEDPYVELCKRARQALDEKRYTDVLLETEKALIQKSGGAEAISLRIEALVALAQKALEADDPAGALVYSRDVVRLRPENAEAKALHFKGLLSLAKKTRDIAHAREALRFNPASTEAKAVLVECLLAAGARSADSGRWTEVEERLQELRALAPEDAGVKALAKRLEDERNKTPEAETYETLCEKAQAALDSKRYKDVLAVTEKALKDKPDGKTARSLRRQALTALAREACDAQRWEEARDFLAEAAKLGSDDKETVGFAAWAEGHILEKAGKWAEAAEAYDVAARNGVQESVSRERAALSRARGHHAGKRYERVEYELEQIFKSDPSHKEASEILARATLDSTRLVVVYGDAKRGGIHLRDLRTGKDVLIAAGGKIEAGIDWSPERSEFVFVEEAGGTQFLAIADREGRYVKRLTDASAKTLRHPSWSGDGKKIAVSLSTKEGWEVAIIDRDNGRKIEPPIGGKSAIALKWAPDGRRVACWRLGERGMWELVSHRPPEREPGRHGRPLIFAGLPEPAEWSSDGKWLLFGVTGDRNKGLYMAPGEPGLTTERIGDGSPTSFGWSPDGKRIAFGSVTNNIESVTCLTSEGEVKGTLSKKSSTYRRLQWSPDSGLIGYLYQEPKARLQIRAWNPDRDRERVLFTFDEEVQDARLFWWANK